MLLQYLTQVRFFLFMKLFKNAAVRRRDLSEKRDELEEMAKEAYDILAQEPDDSEARTIARSSSLIEKIQEVKYLIANATHVRN
jgi:hypothetical protein